MSLGITRMEPVEISTRTIVVSILNHQKHGEVLGYTSHRHAVHDRMTLALRGDPYFG
jgi:hypothetical protein